MTTPAAALQGRGGKKLNVQIQGEDGTSKSVPVEDLKDDDAAAASDDGAVTAAAVTSAADGKKRKKRTRLQRLMDALAQAIELAESVGMKDRPEYATIVTAVDTVNELIASGYTPPAKPAKAAGTGTGKGKRKVEVGSKVYVKPDLIEALGEDWKGLVEVATITSTGVHTLKNSKGGTTVCRRRDVSVNGPREKKVAAQA